MVLWLSRWHQISIQGCYDFRCIFSNGQNLDTNLEPRSSFRVTRAKIPAWWASRPPATSPFHDLCFCLSSSPSPCVERQTASRNVLSQVTLEVHELRQALTRPSWGKLVERSGLIIPQWGSPRFNITFSTAQTCRFPAFHFATWSSPRHQGCVPTVKQGCSAGQPGLWAGFQMRNAAQGSHNHISTIAKFSCSAAPVLSLPPEPNCPCTKDGWRDRAAVELRQVNQCPA